VERGEVAGEEQSLNGQRVTMEQATHAERAERGSCADGRSAPSAVVPVRAGREVGQLVEDVITLGGVIESVALRLGDQPADAGAGQADARFERRKVGQLIAGALGSGKVECLVHRGQEVPNRRVIWQTLGGPGGGVCHRSPRATSKCRAMCTLANLPGSSLIKVPS
jgi:hypothetical protein